MKLQDHKRSTMEPGAGLSRRGRMILDSGGTIDQQVIKAFATGLPETRTFPTDVWERLQRQALKDYRAQVLLAADEVKAARAAGQVPDATTCAAEAATLAISATLAP